MTQDFDIHILKSAIYDAASAIKELKEGVEVFSKLHEVDLVTEADLKSEEILINAITKHFPNDGIISEESETINSDAPRIWVIDPLDGTLNFIRGYPHYAISIALRIKGRLDQAIIYDPLKDELFTASRGEGAQINGQKIRVSVNQELESALLATGFPVRKKQRLSEYLNGFSKVLGGL